ncbi:MAG: hypothetical protein IPK89_06965 [Sphingomonadales bacterium]|nr:hypothetical protein [Sphingomonadales bacterium]
MVRAIGAFFVIAGVNGGAASSPHPAAVGSVRRGKPLESIADPDGKRCADELLQLRGFDRLGSAFKKNLAQFAGCFITEPGLLCIEFFALLAQLLERITRARFGPGHQIVLSLAVGPSTRDSASMGHVGKRFCRDASAFHADVGEVSRRKAKCDAGFGAASMTTGPTIFTGQARQNRFPHRRFRGRAIAVPDPARHPHLRSS